MSLVKAVPKVLHILQKFCSEILHITNLIRCSRAITIHTRTFCDYQTIRFSSFNKTTLNSNNHLATPLSVMATLHIHSSKLCRRVQFLCPTRV